MKKEAIPPGGETLCTGARLCHLGSGDLVIYFTSLTFATSFSKWDNRCAYLIG